jgi:hypothetical protein
MGSVPFLSSSAVQSVQFRCSVQGLPWDLTIRLVASIRTLAGVLADYSADPEVLTSHSGDAGAQGMPSAAGVGGTISSHGCQVRNLVFVRRTLSAEPCLRSWKVSHSCSLVKFTMGFRASSGVLRALIAQPAGVYNEKHRSRWTFMVYTRSVTSPLLAASFWWPTLYTD